MKKFLLLLALTMMSVNALRAQIYDEDGQYVDTIFHDHINRQAEDFVKAYLCIAEPTDWKDDFLGVNGHAFIRLVCDAFDMDYCFSYESESVEGQMDKYLKGELKMGMFAIPTEEYLVDYRTWNRAVHQYKLNLPPNVKQRLWEIMDNRVMDGNQLKMDLNKRGCSVSAVRFIVRALGELKIEYPQDLPYKNLTLREIQYQSMKNTPWVRLAYDSWMENVFNQQCDIEDKMVVPKDVPEIWGESTLLEKPVVEYDCDIVEAPIVQFQKPFITPLRLAGLLLLISLILALLRYKGICIKGYTIWMWIWLVTLVLFSAFGLYMFYITKHIPTSSLILIILFNMCPLIFWHWRKIWQLPYAILLFIGVGILWFWPHMMVDPFYVVMGLNVAILFTLNWVLEKRDTAKQ